MNSLTSPEDWIPFLESLAEAAQAPTWPGSPGCPEPKLRAFEQRFGASLPPSYRAFLKISNGWNLTTPFLETIRPLEKVKNFTREFRDWADAYQKTEPLELPENEYFDYGNGDPFIFDPKHLRHALSISDIGDAAILLLNPMVVWPDGEWEAWFFANWLPGANRYRSFADWMRHHLATLSLEPFKHHQAPNELPVVFRDAPGKPARRIEPRQKVHELAQTLKMLANVDPKKRRIAAERLALRKEHQAVDALTKAMKTDADHYVRMEAAKSLGRIGSPSVISDLISSIDDPMVNTSAVHALGKINDERASAHLLKLVAEGHEYAGGAMYCLQVRKDTRVIPLLIKMICAVDPTGAAFGEMAALTLGEFGTEEAFETLAPLVSDPDLIVRRRAFRGLNLLASCAKSKAAKTKTIVLLNERLAAEPDSGLPERIANGLEHLPKSPL